MRVKTNDLYRNGWVEKFPTGEMLLLREKYTAKATLTDRYHVLKRGELLDSVAWQYYKDEVKDASKFWWIIADVNSIFNPLDLSDYVGKQIIIPNLIKAELRL